MKECGIEKRVFELELELTETEQMTCGVLDGLLGEDVTDEIVGVIDAAYEAGQDAAVEVIREEFERYEQLEITKNHLVRNKLLYSEDPKYEREFMCAGCEQDKIKKTMMEIFGEDAVIERIGDKIYMRIGRIRRV